MSEESIRRRRLIAEVNRLQRYIDEESRQTIEAIRSGEVDAFVVGGEGHEKVFVLKSPDPPYRLIVPLPRSDKVLKRSPLLPTLAGNRLRRPSRQLS